MGVIASMMVCGEQEQMTAVGTSNLRAMGSGDNDRAKAMG